MQEIIEAIKQMDPAELSELELALIQRRKKLNPDWEFIFLSVPCLDLQEREKELARAFQWLKTFPR